MLYYNTCSFTFIDFVFYNMNNLRCQQEYNLPKKGKYNTMLSTFKKLEWLGIYPEDVPTGKKDTCSTVSARLASKNDATIGSFCTHLLGEH
jgi:hypothetical protein